MASVSVRNLQKRYGAVQTLHGIDIDFEDGTFVALVGPSGCGKSTLLRMIAGLEPVTGGTIEIAGKPVNDVAPKNRNIAMVFQNYALYPHMTVAQNMGYSLKLQKLDKATIRQKVHEAAAILGLEDLLDRYPRQLSGGQRQRAAMGRAIVRKPAVFLFDEPLSNLDAKLRVQIRSERKSLHQRLKTTTIYVTHDQVEAMTMADKIVVMRDGRIEQVGAPLELYDHPANVFIAGFIGSPSMNFVTGAVTESGFTTPDGLTLPLDAAARDFRGAAIYGIRPEQLDLARNDETGAFPIIVDLVEPTGSDTQIVGRVGNQAMVATFRERIPARPGDELRVVPQPGAVRLFDGATTRALEPRPTPIHNS